MDNATLHGHVRNIASLEKALELLDTMVKATTSNGSRYAVKAGGLDSIVQDAIATAKHHRSRADALAAEVDDLEQQIRELEGDDPEGSMHAAADLDASRGMD